LADQIAITSEAGGYQKNHAGRRRALAPLPWLCLALSYAVALNGCVDTSKAPEAAGGGGTGGGSGVPPLPTPATPIDCPDLSAQDNPLGCKLAWGANGNRGNRAEYLDLITTWVGYEPDGGLNGGCDGCGLVRSGVRTAFYAYFIGYQASAAGYGDCNTDFDGQNLCTHGARWLKENRDRVLEMYGNYARMSYEANPERAVLWLLEGDFVQYTYADQSDPLNLQELGALAADITCAIKSNAPNALVAINHSPWLANDLTDAFWHAMPLAITDMIWTTGVGNNAGFLGANVTAKSYNGTTARYDYLHQLTGKRIFVDTSFGASQQADSWSNNDADTLNERIAEGVSAVNVTQPPSDYQARLEALVPQLQSTCE